MAKGQRQGVADEAHSRACVSWLACPPAPALAAFNAESLTNMKSLHDVTDTHARTSCEKEAPDPATLVLCGIDLEKS